MQKSIKENRSRPYLFRSGFSLNIIVIVLAIAGFILMLLAPYLGSITFSLKQSVDSHYAGVVAHSIDELLKDNPDARPDSPDDLITAGKVRENQTPYTPGATEFAISWDDKDYCIYVVDDAGKLIGKILYTSSKE